MFLIIITNNTIKAQEYIDSILVYPTEDIIICNQTSPLYLSKYYNLTYNIPDINNPEIKTMKVNFNILCKDDGTGNFSGDATGRAQLNQIFGIGV